MKHQNMLDELDPTPPLAHNFSDLTGKRFGRLLVVEYAGKRIVPDARKRSGVTILYWSCLCDCGNSCIVPRACLTKKSTRSCGCLNIDTIIARNTSHGMTDTPTHNSWRAMMERCYNPKTVSFKNYGGRGVRVCDRWHAFENFLADMGERPSVSHSLDRSDNEKDYSPDNCTWATKKQQSRNTRRNVIVTYLGRNYVLTDLAIEVGIPYGTLRSRIFEAGNSPEEAVSKGKYMGKQRKNSHALKALLSADGT